MRRKLKILLSDLVKVSCDRAQSIESNRKLYVVSFAQQTCPRRSPEEGFEVLRDRYHRPHCPSETLDLAFKDKRFVVCSPPKLADFGSLLTAK